MHRYAIALSVAAGFKLNENVGSAVQPTTPDDPEMSNQPEAEATAEQPGYFRRAVGLIGRGIGAVGTGLNALNNAVEDYRAGTNIRKATQLSLSYEGSDILCNTVSAWFVRITYDCHAVRPEYRYAFGMISRDYDPEVLRSESDIFDTAITGKGDIPVRLDYGNDGQIWYNSYKQDSDFYINVPCSCLLLANRDSAGKWVLAAVDKDDKATAYDVLLAVAQTTAKAAKVAVSVMPLLGTAGTLAIAGALSGDVSLPTAAAIGALTAFATNKIASNEIKLGLDYPAEPRCGDIKPSWFAKVTASCGIDCVGCYAQIAGDKTGDQVPITVEYLGKEGEEPTSVEKTVSCHCLSMGAVTGALVGVVKNTVGLFKTSDRLLGAIGSRVTDAVSMEDSTKRYFESMVTSRNHQISLVYHSVPHGGCPLQHTWWFVRITPACQGLDDDFLDAYGSLTGQTAVIDGTLLVRLDYGGKVDPVTKHRKIWYDSSTRSSIMNVNVPCDCILLADRVDGTWVVTKKN